jgi:hypothetical protein
VVLKEKQQEDPAPFASDEGALFEGFYVDLPRGPWAPKPSKDQVPNLGRKVRVVLGTHRLGSEDED